MRVMVKFRFPTVSGNEAMKNGRIGKLLPQILEELKPEAAYFYPDQGLRAGFFIVEMADSSKIVDVGERLWMALGGEVEMTPVMNAQDLQKGLGGVAGIIAKYS